MLSSMFSTPEYVSWLCDQKHDGHVAYGLHGMENRRTLVAHVAVILQLPAHGVQNDVADECCYFTLHVHHQ